jgi:hypothetical protein
MDTNVFIKIPTIHVTHSNLNKIIMKKYDLESFDCSIGVPNSAFHLFAVDGGKPAKWKMEILEKCLIKKNCEYYDIDIILSSLCRMGDIEPGEYVVSFSW